jgi:serine/threonine-protein kinase
MLDRFQREVEATAQLAHPNIVTAFDAGEDKGIRFLVMEYVEGNDLESLILERGPLPMARAAEYILQAAQGLEYAHWHGMVHRDIKPSNLILDWRGTIKLVDFGLVGLVPGVASPDADGKTAPTRKEAGVLGTPDYVSPEQVADPTFPGPASDIYSLGCTLYFLLVGRPVFGGETAKAKLLAHQDQPAPSLRAARPDATESLDRLFRHMLAKRPEDRPATMADVIHELENCLQALFSGRSPGSNQISAAGAGAAASGGARISLGTLEIVVGKAGLAVRVTDGDERVVVDCPLGQGIAKFALLPGRYRLNVCTSDQKQSGQEFEIVADQRKVVEVH